MDVGFRTALYDLIDQTSAPAENHAGIIRVRLVGSFQISDSAGAVTLPKTRKARAVLAILAHAAPNPVSRLDLIGLLWSRRERQQAFGSLRQVVHELQHVFARCAETPLRVSRTDLRLVAELIQVDTAKIARLGMLDAQVLEQLGGTLLDDLDDIDPAFDAWLAAARGRFAGLATRLGEARLSTADGADDVIAIGDALLCVNRRHEPFWHALIVAYAELGDTAQALTLYKRCEAALAEISQHPNEVLKARVARMRAGVPAPAGPRSVRLAAKLGVQPLLGLGDAGPELAFAVSEAIIAALAGFRSVSLIPVAPRRCPEDAPPGTNPAASKVELDWLLEGSIQQEGPRVRVSLRLIDQRRAGELAWVKRIERDADDLLHMQDEIASEVAAQLDTRLQFLEAQHNLHRGSSDAYGLLMPTIPLIYQLDQTRYLSAGDKLADAARLAPEFAAVHAWWAFWHVFLVGQGWSDDPHEATRLAGELAQRAVMLDPLDARVLALAGHVRGFLNRGHAHGAVLLDKALALNPHLPVAWVSSGLNRGYAGDHAEAIRRINQGRRLSPADPHSFFFDAALMLPMLLSGQFSKVIELGERVEDLNPRLSTAHRLRLSALGHLGRAEEAARLRDVLGRLEPNFNLRDTRARSPITDQADLDLYIEGLRLAGAR